MMRSLMKRLLVLLAAMLLLAQWSYAAAGAYCRHEGDRAPATAAAHWGHHFHAHAGEDQAPDDGGDAAKASWHGDCASCHAASAFGPVTWRVPLGEAIALPPVAAAAPGWADRITAPPDRPQWPRSASAPGAGVGVRPAARAS